MSKKIQGRIRLGDIDPADTGGFKSEDDVREKMERFQKHLYDLHYQMYAENRRALLIILQGIDASGKDGTVRYLAGGFNPQGLKIHSFKKPSALEIDHAPSRLLPPPPALREAAGGRWRLSFGLLCFAGRSGALSRDPDSDFSRLPMVPPMLPDWARRR